VARSQVHRLNHPDAEAGISACLAFSIIIGVFAAAAVGAQQTAIVGGVVVSATSGEVLPYSTVSIVGGAQRFTAADGSFSFALAPGQYSFRIRQLGYAPLDTLIPVNPGANLRALTFALKPAAYRLDIVRTYANSCSGAISAESSTSSSRMPSASEFSAPSIHSSTISSIR
jgi:Carboxypeptidase regulatory-like domain